MTQMMNTQHAAPLAPGEIRTHETPDGELFQLAVVDGVTLATRNSDWGGRGVIARDTDAGTDSAAVVRAYAAAIELAESGSW